jgi:hypothetical protein
MKCQTYFIGVAQGQNVFVILVINSVLCLQAVSKVKFIVISCRKSSPRWIGRNCVQPLRWAEIPLLIDEPLPSDSSHVFAQMSL